jgi:hypothetical protein
MHICRAIAMETSSKHFRFQRITLTCRSRTWTHNRINRRHYPHHDSQGLRSSLRCTMVHCRCDLLDHPIGPARPCRPTELVGPQSRSAASPTPRCNPHQLGENKSQCHIGGIHRSHTRSTSRAPKCATGNAHVHPVWLWGSTRI